MAEQVGAKSDRATALANRLRLLQIDFADDPEKTRREYLEQEVRQALATVPASDRQAFLQDLAARFPTWDAGAAKAPSKFDQEELRDSSFLVTRLLEVSATLTEPQRQAIAAKLKQGGLGSPGEAALPPSAAEVGNRLQLGSAEQLDPTRAMELLATLIELTCSLDQAVWKTWQTIAPQNNVQRPAALQRTMGRFAAGESEVPRVLVTQDVNKLRQLVAALLFAIPQAGRFAIQHFRNISPEEIRILVGTGGFGAEAKCWRKYVELCESTDVGAVDDAIRKSIAEYAGALMTGAR